MKLKILALLVFVITAGSLFGQGLQAERNALETLVSDWKVYHNSKDLNALKFLYAPKVWFYGQKRAADQLIKDKAKQLSVEHDFIISIKSDIHFTTYRDGIVKCSFIKAVYYKHKLREYLSYIVFKKDGNTYKIIGESDKYTDQHLPAAADWGTEVALDEFLVDTIQTGGNSGTAPYAWAYWLSGGLVILGCWILVRRSRFKRSNAGQSAASITLEDPGKNDQHLVQE